MIAVFREVLGKVVLLCDTVGAGASGRSAGR